MKKLKSTLAELAKEVAAKLFYSVGGVCIFAAVNVALFIGIIMVGVTLSRGSWYVDIVSEQGRSEMRLQVGESCALDLEYDAPRDPDITSEQLERKAARYRVRWSSSDDQIAAVDENGVVTAKSPGEVWIEVVLYKKTSPSSKKSALYWVVVEP